MTSTEQKDDGIQAVKSAVAVDKLVKIRVTLASVAAQLMLSAKPAPQEMSRFEFSASQNEKVKAIKELIEMAHHLVSELVTIPNLYQMSLKDVLSNQDFLTQPPNTSCKKTLQSSSSLTNGDVICAVIPVPAAEDLSKLYGVRIGAADNDGFEDELTIQEFVALMNKKEKVYLVLTTDCGNGKYMTGMVFFLRKVLQDRSSFWIMGPFPVVHGTQMLYSNFEVQVPALEMDLTPPLEI